MFNQSHDVDFFPISEYLLTDAQRIKSLRNPEVKMSKSDRSERSRICLDDDTATIKSTIKQALTDFTSEVCNVDAHRSVLYAHVLVVGLLNRSG